jgi:uncharacterized DUF497 family protein
MKYEWDPDKERSNRSKHGVRFADAVAVFEDDRAITIEDPDHDEARFVTIGMAFSLNLLVVVFCYRHEDTIRVISARTAQPHERSIYANGI